MRYYNMSQLLAKKADVNFAIGGRCSGKSFQMAAELLIRWLEDGSEFMRATRSWSYMFGLENYFSEVCDAFNEGRLRKEQYKRAGQIYADAMIGIGAGADIATYEEEYAVSVKYDHNKYFIKQGNGEWKPFGYVTPLSQEHTKKSNQYPNVKTMFLEEFVAPSPLDYTDGSAESELRHLESLISTVFRHRKGCQLFFVGNNLDISNPYFEFFGVRVQDLKLGQIVVYKPDFTMQDKVVKGATIAVEFVPVGWDNVDEIPMLLRLPGNDIAVTGQTTKDKHIMEGAVEFVAGIDENGFERVMGYKILVPLSKPLCACWAHYRGNPCINVYTEEVWADDKMHTYLTLMGYDGLLLVAEIPDAEVLPLAEQDGEGYFLDADIMPLDLKYRANLTDGDIATLWGTGISRVVYNDAMTMYDYITDRREIVEEVSNIRQLGFGSAASTESVKDYKSYMEMKGNAGYRRRDAHAALDTLFKYAELGYHVDI